MNLNTRKCATLDSRISLLFVAMGFGGCLQTAPVVVVTPADQAARQVYNCPSGKTLDVTRVQNSSSALLVVDGKTLRLPRDTTVNSGERYTNRLQTLTLFSSGATFQNLGQVAYGPCTAVVATVAPPIAAEVERPPVLTPEQERQNSRGSSGGS